MVSVVSAAFLDKWLLLYHIMLLDRVFHRTTGQKQIGMSPISSSACAPQMYRLSEGLSHRSQPNLVDQAAPTLVRPSGIRIGTLSHDARISICIFTVFPDNAGTNLRRRSDGGA